MNSSATVACSTSSLPVWRAKAWKSRTEPGSVEMTFSTVAARHVGERLLRLQDRKRAVQPARVDFFLGLHGGPRSSADF
jgi:hypothetical protein